MMKTSGAAQWLSLEIVGVSRHYTWSLFLLDGTLFARIDAEDVVCITATLSLGEVVMHARLGGRVLVPVSRSLCS